MNSDPDDDAFERARRNRTVPPRVLYKNRSCTDSFWACLFALFFVAYIGCGFYIVDHGQPRYVTNESGQRLISEFFLEDATECCAGENAFGPVCDHLVLNGTRRLQAGNSTFDGDEGMFDAFAEAPEIVAGILATAFGLTLFWLLLLRFCSRPIVVLMEVFRIAILIYLGIASEHKYGYIVFFGLAGLFLIYVAFIADKLMFAADMIAYSIKALKHNPSILLGSLFFMLLYVGNTALYIYFFISSISAAKVKNVWGEDYPDMPNYCEFQSDEYLQGMFTIISFAHLWNLLFIDKMRLYVIANIVGSWHFHPKDERIGLCTAISNIPSSFGTLSIASLLTSIGEKINRTLNMNCCASTFGISWFGPNILFVFPLQVINCILCNILSTLVMMFTKYSVVLHVFTGSPFTKSAKSVFKILSRHFKGGFVTAETSKSLLNLGAYSFSILLGMVTWWMVDDRFDCQTFENRESDWYLLIYFLLLVVNVWYPLFGIYFVICLNTLLKWLESIKMEEDLRANYYDDDLFQAFTNKLGNHIWIPPLSACFVGCVSMLFFNFFSTGIIMDTVDTCFLCFTIDCDNNVDNGDSEFHSLIEKMPGYNPPKETREKDDIEKVWKGESI
jgi:hypothetical protein